MEEQKTITNNFKRLRKARKIRQEDMAEALGISTATLSMYENGKRLPNSGVLQRMSAILHVSVSELIGKEADDKFPNPNPEPVPLLSGPMAVQQYEEILDKARSVLSEDMGDHDLMLLELMKHYEHLLGVHKRSVAEIQSLKIKLEYATELLYNWKKSKGE